MPTFVANGPFVPDRLVQQLEGDRVVIFCGAGISMGAGLPSYLGLVDYCYQELGEPLPPKKSPEWLWPDRMLGAVENRYGSAALRRKVVERLDQPPSDLVMHQAILKLATIRGGNGIRLVTTNFDTYFEQAQKGLLLGRDFHSGPILPIPRNDRIVSWRSIVYLHGRLEPSDQSNEHLVLTSGDFGRAYLTEAWAARFVARLFADFTVLFIGYSLNDPVLRYMTDAFAAEEALARGRAPRGPAYIFLSYTGSSPPDAQPWRERKLEPIFYNQMRNHLRLKQTLVAWADARQDYLSNTRVLIERVAPSPPDAQHPSDVENLIWAVIGRPGDEGHGARVFASIDPPPPLQWLIAFERSEQDESDAYRRAVEDARRDGAVEPIPPVSRLESLFPSAANEFVTIDPAARGLLPWIVRYLGDGELTDWVIGKLRAGRRAHAALREAIRKRLDEDSTLPDGFARFWRVISAEGDWSYVRPGGRYRWHLADMVKNHGDTAWGKRELAAALRPALSLSPSFFRHWRDEGYADLHAQGSRFSHVADAEVNLADDDQVPGLVDVINGLDDADDFLASNLDLLTVILRDVLELFAIVNDAGPDYDPSVALRPSIEPHQQNNHHHSWLWLFDLIWRGWTRVDATDASLSIAMIEQWRRVPFLAFRRLALAAIGNSANLSTNYKLQALLDV